jgi:hypothetical protein
MIAGPWAVFIVFITLVALLGYVIYVTGLSISIRIRRRKTLGLELLLRGRLLTKPVTQKPDVWNRLWRDGLCDSAPWLSGAGYSAASSLDVGRMEGHLAGRLPALAGFWWSRAADLLYPLLCARAADRDGRLDSAGCAIWLIVACIARHPARNRSCRGVPRRRCSPPHCSGRFC